MNTKTTHIILIGLTLGIFGVGVYFYPQLPEQMASHWNTAGQADGYMDKFWGIFFIPALMSAFYALFMMIPQIDPLKNNFKDFEREYNLFWIAMTLFFTWIFGLQILWNLGVEFDFSIAIIIALGLLWFFVGSTIQNAKQNWFFGIRTPWTLSSPKVWKKTHLLGGKLFKIASLITLLSVFLPNSLMVFGVITPILLTSVFLLLYSYSEHKKLK